MSDCFVFGSNRAGTHHGGSASHAHKNHGAIWGCGEGIQGDSYAIPTLDEDLARLPLEEIKSHVNQFIAFATSNMNMTFKIVAIGCGIAGFKPHEIAPMFKDVPDNCILPKEFQT